MPQLQPNIMIINGEKYQSKASEQQLYDSIVTAPRGDIYDRNMNVLAVDYTVYTVFISPRSIETEIQHKLTVDGLVEILGVEKEDVEKHISRKNSMYEVIAKEVSEEKASELDADGNMGI